MMAASDKKPRKFSVGLSEKLETELPIRLNEAEEQERYTVSPRINTISEGVSGVTFSSDSAPDLIVVDNLENRTYFIEVKGTDPSSDIPVAASGPIINEIKYYRTNPIRPMIFFVSASGISEGLKKGLDAEDVTVIEGAKSEDIVGDVVRGIREYYPKPEID